MSDRKWREAARQSIDGAAHNFEHANDEGAGLDLVTTYMRAASIGVTAAIAEALLDLADAQHRGVTLSERLYRTWQTGTLPDDLDAYEVPDDELDDDVPDEARHECSCCQTSTDDDGDEACPVDCEICQDEDDDEDDDDARRPGEPRSLVGLLGDALIDAVNRADFWEGVAEGAETANAELRDELANVRRQLDNVRDELASAHDAIVRYRRETTDEDV